MTDLQPARPQPGVHANLVGAVPHPPPPWLDWDSYYQFEQHDCWRDRFDMDDYALPADLYRIENGRVVSVRTGTYPERIETPWESQRREDARIAREVVASMLTKFAVGEYDSVAVNSEIDRELYRRRITADRQRLAGIVELFRNLGG